MTIDDFEKEMDRQREEAENDDGEDSMVDGQSAQPRRRKSLRLQKQSEHHIQEVGQAEEAEGAISNESDDFFSPVASADALAPLEGQQKEFKTLRRRHSVMPAQNSSRGTIPQSIDEPAPKARAQRRTPQSRARVKFARKRLVSAKLVAAHYDRSSVQPNLFSCDVCSKQFAAGLSGFEHYWHCNDCEEFDMCKDCLEDLKNRHNSKHSFDEIDPGPASWFD